MIELDRILYLKNQCSYYQEGQRHFTYMAIDNLMLVIDGKDDEECDHAGRSMRAQSVAQMYGDLAVKALESILELEAIWGHYYARRGSSAVQIPIDSHFKL